MTDASGRLPLASVALVSSAALANEILLTRMFAVVHWHHFAYMIISLALLGFGASGAFLALARRPLLRHLATSYLASLSAFAALAVASPVAAQALPFHAEALLWDPWQPAWLVLVYLVLAAPFFCAANALGLALTAFRERAGRVYAADLAGAGLGAVLVLTLLYRLWPEDVLRAVAATGLLAVLVGAIELRSHPRAWGGVALAGLAALALVPGQWLRAEPGPYKGLSQALQVAGARVVLERSSPLGRITIVENPAVPLRHAPGLSLAAVGEPPPQLGMFIDGDGLQAITAASNDPSRLAFLRESTASLAYRLRPPRTVLVLAAGGGMEILRAQALGAARIDALELDAQVARLLTDDFRDFASGLVAQPGTRLYTGEARGFLADSDRRYDLIQLPLAGAAGGGLGGLNEDYSQTVEAFRLYLAHLAPGGYITATRPAQVPPRDALKLVATAVAALESLDGTDPAAQIVMVRGWQAVTLAVKNGRVSNEEIARLHEFCDAFSFDLVWYPGMSRGDANVFNQLPGPWYHDGVRALLGPAREAFIARYDFDIRPTTDEAPYFQNFFRWRVLWTAWSARERGGMALLEAGYLLLAATLGQAILLGGVLILLPLVRYAPLAGTRASQRWRVLGYFTAIGLAFLFVEIAFLQKLVLLMHHPTVALAITLATFLVGAGVGSAWAGRAPAGSGLRWLVVAIAGIVLLGAAGSLAFDTLIGAIAAWPAAARALVAAALLSPLAFCMGMPFPLALRELDEALVPWAWGINGCASVVSAALATLLAVDFGFSTVLWLAAALYLVLPLAFPR